MKKRSIEELHRLEDKAKVIANVLQDVIGKECGWAFFLFDLGEGGWLTYLSNGDREDMIRLLREQLKHFEAEAPTGHATDGET